MAGDIFKKYCIYIYKTIIIFICISIKYPFISIYYFLNSKFKFMY